jgi:hypothetical protein
MGLLDRLRGKPSAQEDNQAVNAVATAQVYTRNQTSAHDAEDRTQKGIDIDMIDPQDVIAELTALAHYEYSVLEDVLAVDKDGETVFEDVPLKNPDGSVVLEDKRVDTPSGIVMFQKQVVYVKQPKMAKQMSIKTGTRCWAIAALGYMNKVWPTIWMSPEEADTTWLSVRTAFHDIRKCMSYAEKAKYGIVLRMARDFCLARCEDMKDGHKGLLIKIRREELGVHMSRGNNNGERR